MSGLSIPLVSSSMPSLHSQTAIPRLKPSSNTISRETWAAKKDTIELLYVKQDLELGTVVTMMNDLCSFSARYAAVSGIKSLLPLTHPSIQQYKRKFNEWGFKKNKKASEWLAISRGLKRRGIGADDAVVSSDGKQISAKRLKRELARHDRPTMMPRQGLLLLLLLLLSRKSSSKC